MPVDKTPNYKYSIGDIGKWSIVAGVFGSFPKTIVKRKLLVKAFAIAIY